MTWTEREIKATARFLPLLRRIVEQREAELIDAWKVTQDERERDRIWQRVGALGDILSIARTISRNERNGTGSRTSDERVAAE